MWLTVRKLTFTGFYVYSKANSDTGGPGYHPSNQYDIMQDYGRQFFDVRNRVFAFANYSAPYGFRISPFLSASSGAPFNIQLSQDVNGDSFFNDRPVFASSASNPANVDTTKYGNFDISTHASCWVEAHPHQLWEWPGSVCDEYARGQELWHRPAGGRRQRSNRGRRWRWAGRRRAAACRGWGWVEPAAARTARTTRVDRRYSITLSAFAHNIFNVVNLAPPNGTLGGPPDGTTDSPFFGKSNQLAKRLLLPRFRSAGLQLSGAVQFLGSRSETRKRNRRSLHYATLRSR